MLERAAKIPVMANLDERLRVMDLFPGYVQVLSLASPPLEVIGGPDLARDLARLANDGMARMVSEHPDRFPSFVASVAMVDVEGAAQEAERALRELGACGVQLFSNIDGRPLDEPEFRPIFALMAEEDRPLWIHPARGMNVADYRTEDHSKYDLWWALGWPYESSLAMGRLVFAAVFDRWPELKVVTHHVGGMVPMMEGRLSHGLELLGTRQPPGMEASVRTELVGRPIDAFRKFYADTASFGSRAAIECGLGFFGCERLVFGTDMPFDPEQGPGYIRGTLKAIEQMDLSAEDRNAILSGNAKRLLKL